MRGSFPCSGFSPGLSLAASSLPTAEAGLGASEPAASVTLNPFGNVATSRVHSPCDIDPPRFFSATPTGPSGADGPNEAVVQAQGPSGLALAASLVLSVGGAA